MMHDTLPYGHALIPNIILLHVVLCKLSQLNLSETIGINGSKFFFGQLIIELKNTSMAQE
jgi:hypothetical protein